MERLSQILSTWITRRDALRQRHARGDQTLSTEFLRTLEESANQLADIFPSLNLAEMEALCELSSSYLTTMRNRQTAFLKGQAGR